MRLACRSVCSALFAVFAWFVTAPASAAPVAGWQAVAVASAEGKAAEILLEDGRRFPLENPESLSGNFGVELRVGGRVLSDDGKRHGSGWNAPRFARAFPWSGNFSRDGKTSTPATGW